MCSTHYYEKSRRIQRLPWMISNQSGLCWKTNICSFVSSAYIWKSNGLSILEQLSILKEKLSISQRDEEAIICNCREMGYHLGNTYPWSIYYVALQLIALFRNYSGNSIPCGSNKALKCTGWWPVLPARSGQVTSSVQGQGHVFLLYSNNRISIVTERKSVHLVKAASSYNVPGFRGYTGFKKSCDMKICSEQASPELFFYLILCCCNRFEQKNVWIK